MKINDEEFVKQLHEYIEKTIDQKIAKKISSEKLIKSYRGTVTAVGSGTADIQLAGESTSSTFPNWSNRTLTVGNTVTILAFNGNLSNAAIIY